MRALPVLLLAALAAGCGAGTPVSSDVVGTARVEVEKHEPMEIRTQIVGASPEQECLLREILAGVDPSHVDKVVIAPVEPGWEPFPEGAVQIALSGPDTSEASWERILVAGAFGDRSADARLPTVEVFGEDGEATSRAGARSALPGPTGEPKHDLEALAASLDDAARQAGARLEELRLLSAWDAALAVTLRVDGDPAEFLAERLDVFLAADKSGSAHSPEGSLLQVLDRTGRVIYASTSTERLGTFGTWIPWELEGCHDTAMPRPADYAPPPCPFRG